MRRFTQWLYYILPLAVLLLGLTFLIHEPQLVQRLRLAVFDTYQRLQPREYTPLPVKVIDVDERSLRELGQWPWPRTLVARLIARLGDAGVSVVGMDFLLAEPDRTSRRRTIGVECAAHHQ
jgi:adenylate cyclase